MTGPKNGEPVYARPMFDQRAINIQRLIDRCASALHATERDRKRYPNSRPCPDCKTCAECGLIVHADKPSMHAPTCSARAGADR